MSSSDVYALSIHADYRCRHSGACCSTDWDVPIELPIYRTLKDAVEGGRIVTEAAARHLVPFVVEPDLPDGAAAIFKRTAAGQCVFLDHGTRLCIVHRDMGETALPATCRHFPRLAVRDGRGTFITLSHFCPTAASMLFREDCAVEIVQHPRAFPPGDYDGLVVTDDDLPPLLTPAMLMDGAGYTAWERHMVTRCADLERSPEAVLATLLRDAHALSAWKPGGITLADAVRRLPIDVEKAEAHHDLTSSLSMYADAMCAVPDEWRPEPDEDRLDDAYAEKVRPAWPRFHAPLNRYLAAKSFASWTAYQGRGVASIVRGLECALALVRVESARQCRDEGRRLDAALLREAFRHADFILNHLAVGEDLAASWSKADS